MLTHILKKKKKNYHVAIVKCISPLAHQLLLLVALSNTPERWVFITQSLVATVVEVRRQSTLVETRRHHSWESLRVRVELLLHPRHVGDLASSKSLKNSRDFGLHIRKGSYILLRFPKRIHFCRSIRLVRFGIAVRTQACVDQVVIHELIRINS